MICHFSWEGSPTAVNAYYSLTFNKISKIYVIFMLDLFVINQYKIIIMGTTLR